VICELLPGVTLPYFRSKNGFSLARLHRLTIAPHAVVERMHVTFFLVDRLDFAAAGSKPAAVLRRSDALVAAYRSTRPSAAGVMPKRWREILRGLAPSAVRPWDR
jgi:hypothetical protein